MDDTLLVRCRHCKTKFRERARRIQNGYSRQCPNCDMVLFFEKDNINDRDVQAAFTEAIRLRRLLKEQEEAKLQESVSSVRRNLARLRAGAEAGTADDPNSDEIERTGRH